MKTLVKSILGAAALCLASIPQSQADQSCTGMLEDLRQYLFQGNVRIHHTTNYLTDAQSFGGWSSQCWLNRMPGHAFSGYGINCSRLIMRDGQAPYQEGMRYDISADGQMTFQGQYGPYDMTCLGDKFAIVNTWDSIETFVFLKQ